MLVFAVECAYFEFITKNKIIPEDLENRNKNDGHGTTNKKTSIGRNESVNQMSENENQNDANG